MPRSTEVDESACCYCRWLGCCCRGHDTLRDSNADTAGRLCRSDIGTPVWYLIPMTTAAGQEVSDMIVPTEGDKRRVPDRGQAEQFHRLLGLWSGLSGCACSAGGGGVVVVVVAATALVGEAEEAAEVEVEDEADDDDAAEEEDEARTGAWFEEAATGAVLAGCCCLAAAWVVACCG